jgi:hypothetical protein
MSTRLLGFVFAFALLVGCASGSYYEMGAVDDNRLDDDDSQGDDDDAWGDDDLSGGCEIQGTIPVDGDPTAYYRDPLIVYFDEPVESVSFTVDGPDGGVFGDTSLSADGLTATFDPHGDHPDQHLIPMSGYGVHVESPGCSADWAFTTSVLGSDLDGAFELQDAVYIVYPEQADLVEPAGLASLLEMLALGPFLLAITAIDGGEVDLMSAGLDLGALQQDTCSMTADLTAHGGAQLTGAHLRLDPVAVDIPFGQQEWSYDSEFWLQGAQIAFDAEFTPDGEQLTEGRIEGVVDGFQLDSLLAGLSDDHDTYWQGSTCDLLEKLGSPCAACPGNPQAQSCIEFELRDVDAYLLDYFGLDEISAVEAANCH